MKKLFILLLLICFSALSFGQKVNVDGALKQALSTYTMDGDTVYTFSMHMPSYWELQMDWEGLDALDATVSILTSLNNVNFSAYPNLAAFELDATTDTGIVKDMTNGTSATWFRVSVSAGTCSSGTLKMWLYFVRKR